MKLRSLLMVMVGLVGSLAQAAVSDAFQAMMEKPVESLLSMTFDERTPGELVGNRNGGSQMTNTMDVVSHVECVSPPCSMRMDDSRLTQSYVDDIQFGVVRDVEL